MGLQVVQQLVVEKEVLVREQHEQLLQQDALLRQQRELLVNQHTALQVPFLLPTCTQHEPEVDLLSTLPKRKHGPCTSRKLQKNAIMSPWLGMFG